MTLFSHDSDSMPRIWTGDENVRAITKSARAAVRYGIQLCYLNLSYICNTFLTKFNHSAVHEVAICNGCNSFGR